MECSSAPRVLRVLSHSTFANPKAVATSLLTGEEAEAWRGSRDPDILAKSEGSAEGWNRLPFPPRAVPVPTLVALNRPCVPSEPRLLGVAPTPPHAQSPRVWPRRTREARAPSLSAQLQPAKASLHLREMKYGPGCCRGNQSSFIDGLRTHLLTLARSDLLGLFPLVSSTHRPFLLRLRAGTGQVAVLGGGR